MQTLFPVKPVLLNSRNWTLMQELVTSARMIGLQNNKQHLDQGRRILSHERKEKINSLRLEYSKSTLGTWTHAWRNLMTL